MAQCMDCYNNPDCEYRKHPSNAGLAGETHHNCQDFNGVVAGYRIHRIDGTWPEGHIVIAKIKQA